jgi:heme exporter protein B
MKDFARLFGFDMRMQTRLLGEWISLILFFLIVILLLPFAIGPDSDLLRWLAPGLIWLAVLLMSLLALEKLFVADARDGTLDLMLLSPMPMPLIIFSKLISVIIMMLGALALMLIPAALLFGLSFAVLPVLLLSLALGAPVLILLGGIAGAITVMLPRNPALLTLLLIPFYIPVLIFAVSACDAGLIGGDVVPHLLFLGAMLAVLLPVAPFVIAAALHNAQG